MLDGDADATILYSYTAESLADILQGLRNIIQSDIHAKHMELFIDTVDVADEEVYCDKLRLNQILLNLTSNAIKFTPAGGTDGE